MATKGKNKCACGCGREAGGIWYTGHDSKIHSAAIKLLPGGTQQLKAIVEAITGEKIPPVDPIATCNCGCGSVDIRENGFKMGHGSRVNINAL